MPSLVGGAAMRTPRLHGGTGRSALQVSRNAKQDMCKWTSFAKRAKLKTAPQSYRPGGTATP